jgi:tetratricopeptide (TPR) repeat protein
MNVASLVAAAAVVSAGVSFAVTQLVPRPAAAPVVDAAPQPVDLAGRLDKLEADLRAALERIESATAQRAPASISDEALAAQIEAILAKRTAAGQPADAAAKKPGAALDYDKVFADLASHSLNWDQKQALWKKAKEAGLFDRLVAGFEAAAKANPYSPQAHVDLGNAYLQKVFMTENFLEKGAFATKSDASYDRALEVDPQNWEARFNKATSLANWPAMLGKHPEAIKHYQILIDQQEKAASEPHHAETYLFLGNLYAQQGKVDLAKDVWGKGLKRFPNRKDLQEKLK